MYAVSWLPPSVLPSIVIAAVGSGGTCRSWHVAASPGDPVVPVRTGWEIQDAAYVHVLSALVNRSATVRSAMVVLKNHENFKVGMDGFLRFPACCSSLGRKGGQVSGEPCKCLVTASLVLFLHGRDVLTLPIRAVSLR